MGGVGVQSYGTNSEMNNMSVRVLGYPGDVNYGFPSTAKYQYSTGEKIISVRDLSFRYSAMSCDGFSGGPIMRTSDNYVVGVHHGTYKGVNEAAGVRITQGMINIILSLN